MADTETTVKLRLTPVEALTYDVQATEKLLAGLKADLRTAIEDERIQARAEAAARSAAIRSAQAALVKPRRKKGEVIA